MDDLPHPPSPQMVMEMGTGGWLEVEPDDAWGDIGPAMRRLWWRRPVSMGYGYACVWVGGEKTVTLRRGYRKFRLAIKRPGLAKIPL